MQTIQTEVTVSDDRRLEIELPQDIEAGTYQVVLVLNPQPQQAEATTPHKLNEAAGKLKIFSQLNPVQWQRQIRNEWDETRLSRVIGFLCKSGFWEREIRCSSRSNHDFEITPRLSH